MRTIILLMMFILVILITLCTYMCVKNGYSVFRKNRLEKKDKVICFLISCFIVGIAFYFQVTGVVVLLHFLVSIMLYNFIFWVIKYKKEDFKLKYYKKYYFIPFLVTLMFIGYGFYNMTQIHEKHYVIESNKITDNQKIAFISDIHYGYVQDPQLLKDTVQELNKKSLDIVILGGDLLDESSTKENMQEVFEVLGQIKSQKGIYYVYGNHDLQTYSESPSYTQTDLEQALEDNHIILLKDEYVSLDDMILAGRENVQRDRKETKEILTGISQEQFVLLVDHQPVGVQDNSDAGVDLQISGHTHAGQIIPVGLLNSLRGAYNYGHFEVDQTDLIVSSGLTGWGFPMRTQGYCEYVIVDIVSTK